VVAVFDRDRAFVPLAWRDFYHTAPDCRHKRK
jgi:hypothetical protein